MEIIINGIYKHFKGGLYKVTGLAKDSESEALYVVYQALYGTKELWIRPLSMFTEKVDKNGQTYRFEYQKTEE